ncbi:hypothetical protein BKA62DRAFT_721070 [Auriculariales sp. MPI-PUGE-AT-0066]|nr:hypothetical protein BKA62DRAFT_721070 [Auriculariales sp. MPI-PUGE-AT-0066]
MYTPVQQCLLEFLQRRVDDVGQRQEGAQHLLDFLEQLASAADSRKLEVRQRLTELHQTNASAVAAQQTRSSLEYARSRSARRRMDPSRFGSGSSFDTDTTLIESPQLEAAEQELKEVEDHALEVRGDLYVVHGAVYAAESEMLQAQRDLDSIRATWSRESDMGVTAVAKILDGAERRYITFLADFDSDMDEIQKDIESWLSDAPTSEGGDQGLPEDILSHYHVASDDSTGIGETASDHVVEPAWDIPYSRAAGVRSFQPPRKDAEDETRRSRWASDTSDLTRWVEMLNQERIADKSIKKPQRLRVRVRGRRSGRSKGDGTPAPAILFTTPHS